MDQKSKGPHQSRNMDGEELGVSANILAKGSQAGLLSNGRQQT